MTTFLSCVMEFFPKPEVTHRPGPPPLAELKIPVLGCAGAGAFTRGHFLCSSAASVRLPRRPKTYFPPARLTAQLGTVWGWKT